MAPEAPEAAGVPNNPPLEAPVEVANVVGVTAGVPNRDGVVPAGEVWEAPKSPPAGAG